MPNGTYGGVRGRKTKVGRKLLRFPPTRFGAIYKAGGIWIPACFVCIFCYPDVRGLQGIAVRNVRHQCWRMWRSFQ